MQHDLETQRLLALTERSMQRTWAELLDRIAERRRQQEQETGARTRSTRKGKHGKPAKVAR